MRMSVLIKGGRVITAADDYVADIFIEGERITLIGESLDLAADRVIDAAGKYVLPGAVDPHTHLEMPWRGETTIDDFESGHTAAAFGGTTTHVDFCIQGKGQTFQSALEAWHAKREGKALIDNGFHIAVTDLREGGTLEELARLPEEHGVTSYKLFMAYKDSLMVDDETLFKTMQVAAATGALVMVHAENGDAIEVLMNEAIAAGNVTPKYHALTRPPELEGEATNRAIQLARVAGSPLYVVHVSCQESAEPIALARDKGWDVWGETCTQYLFIDQSFLDRPDFEGAKYVYTPPPRPKENQEILWNAVRTNVLQAISTDHCAYLFKGQKDAGLDDFRQIPNGGPGLENRLQMIHHFGVRAGRISLNRMVELLCTSPAKLFGLYPRKGTIAPGADADLVLWDPGKRVTITNALMQHVIDYTPYEGMEVTGWPVATVKGGRVAMRDGKVQAEPGTGRFLPRAPYELIKPTGVLPDGFDASRF
jgi:dihydropyrimidinase